MQWLGVVGYGRNVGGFELGLQFIAVGTEKGVLGKYAGGAFGHDMQIYVREICLEQEGIVSGGNLLTLSFFFRELLEGSEEHGGLEGIQPAIEAHDGVMMFAGLAVHADLAKGFGEAVIIGE